MHLRTGSYDECIYHIGIKISNIYNNINNQTLVNNRYILISVHTNLKTTINILWTTDNTNLTHANRSLHVFRLLAWVCLCKSDAVSEDVQLSNSPPTHVESTLLNKRILIVNKYIHTHMKRIHCNFSNQNAFHWLCYFSICKIMNCFVNQIEAFENTINTF